MHYKNILLTFVFVLFLTISVSAAPSTEITEYEVQSPSRASTQLYKGIPIDWYSAYALTEFDVYAAEPGSDWTWGTSNRKFGPDPEDWLAAAKKKGWSTSKNIKDAEVGSLFVFTDSYGIYLAIITEIRPNGLYYQMPNIEGLLTKFWLRYDDPMLRGSHLQGLILPRKLGTLSKSINVTGLPAINTKTDYKGLPASWAPTYAIMEFDKLAPIAVPWTNNIRDWVSLAQTQNLKVSADRTASRTGALLLTDDTAAIVRAVYPERMVIEQSSAAGEISVKQIKYADIKNFAAYIYPEAQ